MAEPEAVRLQGPSYTCGTTTTTGTNFPHRRHYAVRRKLGRAKTARLTAPLSSADAPTVDNDDGRPTSADSLLSTITKEATPTSTDADDDAKCHSNLNDSTECDDDDESDDVESNIEDLEEEEEVEEEGEEEEEESVTTTTEDNDETSVEADDEEDDDQNQTEVDDESEQDTDDDDGSVSATTSTTCASQLFANECVVVVPQAGAGPAPAAAGGAATLSSPSSLERIARTVPVITVIQPCPGPGPSNDQAEETFFVDGGARLLSASSLLYPVDERDAITPTYLTTR